MPDPKQLLSKWIHRKISAPDDPASIQPGSAPSAVVPDKTGSMSEPVLDNLELALSLAEQAVAIAQVAPFIAPAAALLSEILKSYKEVKSANEKRNLLSEYIADLTGDICATVLRMEATNHSDLIGRLKQDLEKYSDLITKASRFIEDYDKQGKFTHFAGRNQLGDEMVKLNQELNSFGGRFRTNRLVDLAINQSDGARTLDRVHDMVVEEKLEKWLEFPPAMKQKQHDTEALRKEGTGRWFLEDTKFVEWQNNPGLLWIEGPSGAGKSVLSATVIKNVFEEEISFSGPKAPAPATAFFYFDFRAKETQRVEIALRRIILQLSAHSPHPYRALDEHYKLSNGQKLPSYKDLQKILQQLFRELGRTYIVLDALDECDDSDFASLVDLVSALRKWTETPLHILFTSQPRQIFTEGFEGITRIALEFNITQGDIRFFIAEEIRTNPKLKIWHHQTDDITDRVARKSNGMFRLAASLLIELARCKWEDQLDKKLENLPDSLFGIYDRFFDTIPPDDLVYVNAALRWIMFKKDLDEYDPDNYGPIPLEMLADAISFDFSNAEEYVCMPNRREANAGAIVGWLEGLVINPTIDGKPRVILAHASVQDYLLSTHFTTRFKCDLSESHSHTFLARTCISYFLYFENHLLDDARSHLFGMYAAERWCQHLLRSHDQAVLFSAAMHLLNGGGAYRALSSILQHRNSPLGFAAPLQLCCWHGYLEGVKALLALNVDINLAVPHTGSALTAASGHGHTNIVCLLLQSGANVNLPDVEGVYALTIAAGRGNIEIVCLLLENGADANLLSRAEGSALAAASYEGNTEIVCLLLENGADVNLPGGEYGSALGAASYRGRTEIVHLLLENSANVNLPGREYGSALGAASYRDEIEIVHLLLENGADVNLPGRKYGSALRTASYMGWTKLVHLLLENGADVNLPGGEYGSALGAASYRDEIEIVRLLLENGADVNILGGEYGSALGVASYMGRTEIVCLLLENGADVNILGGEYGSALGVASYMGRTEIVCLLLENGANVNAAGGEYGSALGAASYEGNTEIVHLLLENGADVNLPGGEYGSALGAATAGYGNIEIIHLLLENGANVNLPGGIYGSVLGAASNRGNKETVHLLLENGANVNAAGGEYGNALTVASAQGHTNIVKLLLENGADVNADEGSAVQAASNAGRTEIVDLLLENGAVRPST
ncbi:ankyrin repeat-containing domain protein [Mycena maculata]|uniref:Ankyrin repeat-containing domain protein n=1 Tax=Mycena maculata TaxID=230809 RepID=A0AAD7NGN4_9AGAR|nr:ankyrin repeat-containing domain protein [Mycena maculata]